MCNCFYCFDISFDSVFVSWKCGEVGVSFLFWLFKFWNIFELLKRSNSTHWKLLQSGLRWWWWKRLFWSLFVIWVSDALRWRKAEWSEFQLEHLLTVLIIPNPNTVSSSWSRVTRMGTMSEYYRAIEPRVTGIVATTNLKKKSIQKIGDWVYF